MTSQTRTQDPPTTQEQPKQQQQDRVALSPVQVAASALASVSAAVVASLFGVAGTVIGAGLVSIIATTGSAIYTVSMRRTSNQLRRARETLAARAAAGTSRTRSIDLTTQPASVRDNTSSTAGPILASAPTSSTALDSQPSWWRRGWLSIGSRKGLRWPALAGAVGLVFVLAIGIVTAVEAITQEPISALTGHKTSSTTTIGSLTGGKSTSNTPSPTPSVSRSGSDTNSTTSAVPSAQPSSRTSAPASRAPATASTKPSGSSAPSTAAPSKGGASSGNAGTSGSQSGSGSKGSTSTR